MIKDALDMRHCITTQKSIWQFNALTDGAFTLSELLIAVAVLGLIATFTIPKVLDSSRDHSANTAAKEVAAAISQIAYQKIEAEGNDFSSLSPADLTSGLQIVRTNISTSEGTTDSNGSTASTRLGPAWTCQDATSVGQSCMILHNGGCLQVIPYNQSGAVQQMFVFDPDSAGPLVRVSFFLYSNGRLTRAGKKGYALSASFDHDPDWFHW